MISFWAVCEHRAPVASVQLCTTFVGSYGTNALSVVSSNTCTAPVQDTNPGGLSTVMKTASKLQPFAFSDVTHAPPPPRARDVPGARRGAAAPANSAAPSAATCQAFCALCRRPMQVAEDRSPIDQLPSSSNAAAEDAGVQNELCKLCESLCAESPDAIMFMSLPALQGDAVQGPSVADASSAGDRSNGESVAQQLMRAHISDHLLEP